MPSTCFSSSAKHLEYNDGYKARDQDLNEPEEEIAQENRETECSNQGESVELNLCYSDEYYEKHVSADNLESGL
jgi:hypothetical protein